jgi:homoserine dehydrogenase
MQTYNLCILGFGNVGRALAQLLLEKTAELRERYDIEWRLTGVATRRMGWIADPAGLDVVALLNGQIPDAPAPGNVREWLAAAQADVLFELTSTDPQTGQPAIDHLRAALERGAHAITANKGALIHAYPELRALAAAQGRRFLFEATVMAGGPVFSLFRDTLPAARLLRFRGLLNSTSNVIIEEMERGRSLQEAVQKAQELGIAETNPSLDVDGWDATLKVCAIATVLMDVPLRLEEIQREGIRGLSPEMVQQARAAGQPFKLIAQAERVGDGVVAYVRPEQLAPHDPLAAVRGGSMLAHFEMDVIPGLTITVHVPDTGMVGPAVTAYDVMADFIRATR